MRTAVVLVVVAVALAGCSGVVPGDRSTPAEATPAPVPTEGVSYPPGVSPHGQAPGVLASVHADNLAETNYTVTTRRRIAGPDGVKTVTHRRRVAAGGDRYVGDIRRSDTTGELLRPGRVDYWSNGTTAVQRLGDADAITKRRQLQSRDATLLYDPGYRLEIESLVAATRLRIASRTPRGGVVLRSDRVSRSEWLPVPTGVMHPSNASVEMRVRYDGVVVAWRVAYDGAVRGESVRVVRTTRVTAVGTTTVERPAWATAVLNGSRETT